MAEKRKVTAREAKNNLEPFGYDGPARWTSIDAFVKANPRAKAAVTANKGAFVQSEALGFSPGGYVKSYINDSGTLVKEREDGSLTKFGAEGNVVEFDAQGQVASNVYGGHTLGADTTKTKTVDLDKDQQAKLGQLFVNPKIDDDGIWGKNNQTQRDYGKGILSGRGDRVAQLVNQGANVYLNDKGQVMLETPDGSEAKLDYNAARRAFQAGLITGGKATYGAAEEETKEEEETTPEDTTPAPPVMSTPKQSAPAPDMPAAVSLEPSQDEIDRAAEIFSSDGTVTLPTGSYDLPSIETPTVEAPEGTTAVDAPTFEANVQRQAEQFKQRGIDQAQLIQPQTRAEKIAAGQTVGKLEQRLYQNRQGMSTYILGVYNSEGVWTPSQPIPQGYRVANVGQAPYLVQQAASAPTTPNIDVTTNPFGVPADKVGDPEYVNVYQGGMIRGYSPGGMPQDPNDETSTPENPITTPDTPTVTVADQPITKEQMAQGQADLTAGAILDPAGTAVAAPVATINPDAEGTVLGATTGQALGTAPIITDPAQAPKTITADTPDKPPVSKVTAQKAEDKIKTTLEGGLDVKKMLDNVKGSSFYKPEYNPETGKITIEVPQIEKHWLRVDKDGNPIPQKPLPPVKREVTPEEFADMFGADVSDFTSQGVQAATSTGPTKTIEAQTQDTTKISDLEAAQGTTKEIQDQLKEDMPTRELQEGELISGSAVDKGEVAETFGTGEVKAASMQDEMTTLMDQFEGGNTPPWAAGAMRKATAVMAQRGLGASSMAGQAIIQAAMEASLPIAQIDTANKQQMALTKAEQRAKFMQMDFDQEFQSKVKNAAKVSEVANMNFTAEQQVALENAKMAQTMNLANLNNRQALVMAEAAQISQLEMASLNNRQQAQVQNAQNFLAVDMANLNNEQATEIFKAQALANTILSDTAASNASEQFNASSENQTEQFFASMKSQISQFNSAQSNAMSQFNAGEANAIQKFNSELQAAREQFNAQMYAQIAQANAKWRQDTTTVNTTAANQSNFQYAKDVNGLTNKAIDEIWQRERDIMNFAFSGAENAKERTMNLILGDKELEKVRLQLDKAENDAFTENIFGLLFGKGGIGNLFGGKGLFGELNLFQ